jgi:hypothetical protein
MKQSLVAAWKPLVQSRELVVGMHAKDPVGIISGYPKLACTKAELNPSAEEPRYGISPSLCTNVIGLIKIMVWDPRMEGTRPEGTWIACRTGGTERRRRNNGEKEKASAGPKRCPEDRIDAAHRLAHRSGDQRLAP